MKNSASWAYKITRWRCLTLVISLRERLSMVITAKARKPSQVKWNHKTMTRQLKVAKQGTLYTMSTETLDKTCFSLVITPRPHNFFVKKKVSLGFLGLQEASYSPIARSNNSHVLDSTNKELDYNCAHGHRIISSSIRVQNKRQRNPSKNWCLKREARKMRRWVSWDEGIIVFDLIILLRNERFFVGYASINKAERVISRQLGYSLETNERLHWSAGVDHKIWR